MWSFAQERVPGSSLQMLGCGLGLFFVADPENLRVAQARIAGSSAKLAALRLLIVNVDDPKKRRYLQSQAGPGVRSVLRRALSLRALPKLPHAAQMCGKRPVVVAFGRLWCRAMERSEMIRSSEEPARQIDVVSQVSCHLGEVCDMHR